MTNKQIKNHSKEKEEKFEFGFFENYNSRVEVVGFRDSWVSEFNDSMKEAYESISESKDKKEAEESTTGNNGNRCTSPSKQKNE